MEGVIDFFLTVYLISETKLRYEKEYKTKVKEKERSLKNNSLNSYF